VRQLRDFGGYDDPGLTMIVENAEHQTLFTIPFLKTAPSVGDLVIPAIAK
jgi:hypothetical protein